ncbi:hypothetical protein [Paenarthrobacter ureafaciens]|uniref:hypothetical protein n=1 Tax=Paenarthrobacter ureafaciens TaxID=37931 RepID=UPI001916D649|nr:hypothetical protein [Paenarthrobacter ureafaciens]QQQ63231.1 hypothetical protein JHQ56_05265 [Paenarthrobacter ureafaciens]
MKKSMFVFLITAAAVVIAAPGAWATAWLVSGKTPSLLVIGVGVVEGLIAGVVSGPRFWDDRNAIRQRAAQFDDS